MTTALLLLSLATVQADDFPIQVYPAARAVAAPKLDGVFDDACWQKAPVVSGFVWYNSAQLAPVQTSFRACWDADALYLAVTCDEPAMSKLNPRPVPLDSHEVFNTEAIEVFVDPHHNYTDYYQFAFNAAGSVFDAKRNDPTWNSGATAATGRQPNAWTLEARIPWAPMAAKPARGQDVGLNVCRDRTLVQDRGWSCWAQVKANFHDPERFGNLVLDPTAQDLAKLNSEFRKGGRTGPLRIYSQGGFGAGSYTSMGKAALKQVQAQLDDLRAVCAKADAPTAAALSKRLAAYDARVAPIAQRLDAPIDGAEYARLELDLAKLSSELGDAIWQARLEAVLAGL